MLASQSPVRTSRSPLPIAIWLASALWFVPHCFAEDRLPNIVLIMADDQGYADLGCYGARPSVTPNLDRLAEEGMRFTDFYVSQPVCGASRASLLTGCYANRLGMLGAPSQRSTHGISDSETLISEICREKGYATAIYGKWHLGHRAPFLPLQHGFDDYFGLPFSNDMWRHHPEFPQLFGDLPMFEGNEIVIQDMTPEDQKQMTTWYTQRAVAFIEAHREQPFFLYVPHNMVHVPLFVSASHDGVSGQGAYADAVWEVDWSVGQILAAIDSQGLRDQTLVLYTSDNGPWLSYGNHAGSALPLREGKGTTFEGGVREPFLARWPGRIPAGSVCEEMAATIDIFPTIARLIGAKLPDHPIDGRDIWPLLSGTPGARSPHDYYCYYANNELQAIRSGDWKLHFPHPYRVVEGPPGRDGIPGKYVQRPLEQSLFNLRDDIGETTDVKEHHPEIVQRLERFANEARRELGDSLRDMKGAGYRPPAQWKPSDDPAR